MTGLHDQDVWQRLSRGDLISSWPVRVLKSALQLLLFVWRRLWYAAAGLSSAAAGIRELEKNEQAPARCSWPAAVHCEGGGGATRCDEPATRDG
jgi:hypothetical protein